MEESYLARFYLAVQCGLEAADILVKVSVLKHFGGLLSHDLPGSNILVPSTVKCLQGFAEAALTEEKISMDVQQFRRSMLQVLKTLLPITHHFGDVVPAKLMKDNKVKLGPLKHLKENIFTALLQNLQSDQELVSCQHLLGMLASFLEHEVALGEAETEAALAKWTASLLNLVCYRLLSSWTQDLASCLAACEVITCLAAPRARPRVGLDDQVKCYFVPLVLRRKCNQNMRRSGGASSAGFVTSSLTSAVGLHGATAATSTPASLRPSPRAR